MYPRSLLLGLALGLVAWAAEGVGFRLICAGLHISGSLTVFVGIYAVAVFAGSVAFFLSAGIGGMENRNDDSIDRARRTGAGGDHRNAPV